MPRSGTSSDGASASLLVITRVELRVPALELDGALNETLTVAVPPAAIWEPAAGPPLRLNSPASPPVIARPEMVSGVAPVFRIVRPVLLALPPRTSLITTRGRLKPTWLVGVGVGGSGVGVGGMGVGVPTPIRGVSH